MEINEIQADAIYEEIRETMAGIDRYTLQVFPNDETTWVWDNIIAHKNEKFIKTSYLCERSPEMAIFSDVLSEIDFNCDFLDVDKVDFEVIEKLLAQGHRPNNTED